MTSLVVQWLTIYLSMQRMWVWSLVGQLRSHMLWGNEAHMLLTAEPAPQPEKTRHFSNHPTPCKGDPAQPREKLFLKTYSVTQSGPTLCDPTDCSMPGFPIHHQLQEIVQTHVHQVGGAIQPSHPLSSPSSPAPNLSQHQGLFKWVTSSRQGAKVLELQLQHQSFQWTPRTDLL